MKRQILGAVLTFMIMLYGFSASQADVLSVQPSKAVVLPSDGTGTTRIALQFDVSGMRPGENRVIDDALLDWQVDGVPANRRSEYKAHLITTAWTVGATVIDASEGEIASWDILPRDFERNGGGFVRFDLREAVTAWAQSPRNNVGVLIVTRDVKRAHFLTILESAVLTVRYGFRPTE